MQTDLGFWQLWIEGGIIVQLTSLVLLIMSLTSWTIICVKGWMMYLVNQNSENLHFFWHSANWKEGIQKLSQNRHTDTIPFAKLAIEGQNAMSHHRQSDSHLHDDLDLSDWLNGCLRNAIDEIQDQFSSGLSVLASIGATATFVGLFGTVWGIYDALVMLSGSGSTQMDQVAGPVGEALVMTALGLFVSIPAVLGYNSLVRSNQAMISKLNRFANDLHAYYLTGNRITRGKIAIQVDSEDL